MNWATTWVLAHGYLAIGGLLFISALGVPLPVGVSLLLAGSAARHGRLSPFVLVAICVVAENLGDTVMYFAGRQTGWWLLSRICRLSLDPEVCIFRSADFFYERGARALVLARFIPGLNTMAPPLAGSLNMRFSRFWRLDFCGTLLHATAWITAGYFLSPLLNRVLSDLALVGHAVLSFFVLAILGYAVTWIVIAIRGRKYRHVSRISADDLRERVENPNPDRPIVIADVRSHGYYDPGMLRIKNSIRVEPSRLLPQLEALRETIAPECDIYVYCSCVRDATSARIAHMLTEQGSKVWVIEGGLKAWTRAGCPTEPVPEEDIHHLPRFD